VLVGSIHWIEECKKREDSLDESGGNYNTRAKVSREQVDVERDAEFLGSRCENWEESDGGRNDQDDEDGRNACSESTIVFVLAGVQVADDVLGVGGVEIDVGWIESITSSSLAGQQARDSRHCRYFRKESIRF
jgi:hypothetical protein